jgi:hypothetical protein
LDATVLAKLYPYSSPALSNQTQNWGTTPIVASLISFYINKASGKIEFYISGQQIITTNQANARFELNFILS